MGVITHSISEDPKAITLETHIKLCDLRFESIEGRLDKIDKALDDMIEQTTKFHHMIISAMFTIITGMVGTFAALHLKLL